jgi:hypothetical protein
MTDKKMRLLIISVVVVLFTMLFLLCQKNIQLKDDEYSFTSQDFTEQALLNAALDTNNNVELLRRIEKNDIQGAKDLLNEIIATNVVELKQYKNAKVSRNSAEIAGRAIKIAEKSNNTNTK